MSARRLAALLLLASLVGAAPRVCAHGMRTGYLELSEQADGQVAVSFRVPARGGPIDIRFPAHCHAADSAQPAALLVGTERRTAYMLQCAAPLAGETVLLRGLGPLVSEVVAAATLRDGSTASALLTPALPRWRLVASPTPQRVSWEYIRLGVRHIFSGADHLLFLLLLVLAVRRVRAVLLAETAFTLSHSLSFSATALGWIQVYAPAAEACIALSLLLLALDVERPSLPPLPAGRAALMALVFGLVHGLGFAGGLREIGIPEQAAAWALLGFGTGVELGQVVFLLAALGLLHALGRSRFLRPVALITTYAAGGLAACWLFERVLLCLRPLGQSV